MTSEVPDGFPEIPQSHTIPQISEVVMNGFRKELGLTEPNVEGRQISQGVRDMGTSFGVRCMEQNGENGRLLLAELNNTMLELSKTGTNGNADMGVGFTLELFDHVSGGELSTKLSTDPEMRAAFVKGLETRLATNSEESIFGSVLRNPPIPETEQPHLVHTLRELVQPGRLSLFGIDRSVSATYGVLSMMWPQLGISPTTDTSPPTS
jgi:hypothetical protein